MKIFSLKFKKILIVVLLMCNSALATAGDFGFTESDKYYTVDTGADLVFRIRRLDAGSSTQSVGDIASMVYRGIQYQDTSRGSHINGGFDGVYSGQGTPEVSATLVGLDYVRITAKAGALTHYYIAKRGEPRIYMATAYDVEPGPGFLRFIVRADRLKLPDGPPESNLDGTDRTIEAGDVKGMPSGETRSKHYSNSRTIDWTSIGATGSNVGLWIVRDNHEGSSGGPFYRSLLNQGTTRNQEITYIVNYGMAQTEIFRPGILNRYTLVFTDGSRPPSIDTSWMESMQLKDYVAAKDRGSVSGTSITGRNRNVKYTVGLRNENAQYWASAAALDGRFSITGAIPGDYLLTVYKNELEVYTSAVSVAAGKTSKVPAIAIVDDPAATPALWRIGSWDGSPLELLNGDKVTKMHPSDVRMAAWSQPDYVIGTSSPALSFPAYQWKSVNNKITIKFTLTDQQLVPYILRAGITVAIAHARPNIIVNGKWTSRFQPAIDQPDTRSLTVGTYRGNNARYDFTIPADALVAGENMIELYVISGGSGDGYLGPGVAYDAVDLVKAP